MSGASHRRLIAGLFATVSVAAFEATAVITALPTITDELGGDSWYGLAVGINLLANIVVIVAAADASDRYGPGRPYIVCAAVYVIGLTVAGFADSIALVIAGRALQGAGVGGFSALAYVAVKRGVPEDRQATAYAWMSAGWVLPALVAPLIAGAITDAVGWRWVFLGIVPFVVGTALWVAPMLWRLAPASQPSQVSPGSRVVAAAIGATGLGLAMGGLSVSRWILAIPLLVGGTAAAVASLRRLLPPGMATARRGLPAVLGVRILATMAFLGADSFLPLAADRIHAASPTRQGTLIIGAAVMWTIGQAIAARRDDAERDRLLIALGFLLLLTGLAGSVLVLDADRSLWWPFAMWSIGGLGMGLLYNPTTVAALSYAEPGNEGAVSAQLTMCDSLGFAIMGGVGGGFIALADRGVLSLSLALFLCLAVAANWSLAGLALVPRAERWTTTTSPNG